MPQPQRPHCSTGNTRRGARQIAAWATLLIVSLAAAHAWAQGRPGDKTQQAEGFYLQAVQSFNAGRYQEALESFDRAIALDPQAIYFCNRGTVLMKLHELPEALASMETCLARFEAADPESLAEKAQIDAEVKGIGAAIRGVQPASIRTATNIATRPLANKKPDIIIVEPIEPGLDIQALGAWTTAGLAGASLLSAAIIEVATVPVIEDFERTAAEGDNRARYDALRTAIDQRKVIIGALVIFGSASALASGLLFWTDNPEEDAGERNRSTLGADLQILNGGATLHFEVTF